MAQRPRISRWTISPRLAGVRAVTRPSDKGVERAVRWLIMVAAATANLAGSAAVFMLAVWVLPTRGIGGDEPSTIANLVLAAAYVLIAIPLGAWWALRRLRPGRGWLKEGREPTAAEQRNLLRAPLHVAFIVGSLWMLAALVFGGFNATYALELGQRVAITVALAGLVTCAVAYLLTERLLRPAAARALAARSLDRPALPGVTARFLFTWLISSGIPLLGISLVALSALTEGDFGRSELARAALGISAAAILFGFVGVLLAARVTADPIVSVRRALGEIERGDLEIEVPVYDGTEVGLLQSGFNRMVDGVREREHVRELFGMHVGEDVARAAMEDRQELGGETRRVAVLFVDIVGSTRIAAERPPEEVVDLLNEFFGLVVEVIDAHRGWVNKFEGDAALAIFGAPQQLDDAAGRALAAGRELSRRLEREIETSAGIGVSYGEVVAGNIGSDRRFEYTVIGDAVNEAARLTELAKERPGRLVAAGRAVDAARGEEAGRWQAGEEVVLRGRSEATVLAVMADSGGPARE